METIELILKMQQLESRIGEELDAFYRETGFDVSEIDIYLLKDLTGKTNNHFVKIVIENDKIKIRNNES